MNTRTRTAALSGEAADMLVGTISTDTTDIDLGGLDKSISLDSDVSLEALRDSMNSRVSHSVDDPHFKKFTQDSAFMEERVIVRLMESSDKTADKIVFVSNDGIPQRFVRGEWVIARRKFVEVLARAKPFSVSTPEVVDGNGDRTTRLDTKSGLLYPFEMNDRNPIGQAWLRSVLQEA